MARKKNEPHIHADVDVTAERLKDFALASRSTQVKVLAALRAKSADDSVATQLSIASLFLAVFVVIAAPLIAVQPDPTLASSWWARLGLMVALVVLLLVAVSPAMWDAAKGHVRRWPHTRTNSRAAIVCAVRPRAAGSASIRHAELFRVGEVARWLRRFAPTVAPCRPPSIARSSVA